MVPTLAGKKGISLSRFTETISYGGGQNFYLDTKAKPIESKVVRVEMTRKFSDMMAMVIMFDLEPVYEKFIAEEYATQAQSEKFIMSSLTKYF